MTKTRLGRWIPWVFAVMTAVDGWLALGSLAQLTVMVSALLKRLRGEQKAAAGGINQRPPQGLPRVRQKPEVGIQG